MASRNEVTALSHHDHLKNIYPELSFLLNSVSPLAPLQPDSLPIPEAVTKIVVGQMLSRVAANTIYARMSERCIALGLTDSWRLPEAELISCGLSRRKVRTIKEFTSRYEHNPASIDAWRSCTYQHLSILVSEHWGLSQWSADMLAIFHFAMPDVFPETDGTIRRVRHILEEHYLDGPLKPEIATPYRTSLARYMWAFLDKGLLD